MLMMVRTIFERLWFSDNGTNIGLINDSGNIGIGTEMEILVKSADKLQNIMDFHTDDEYQTDGGY